MIATLSRNGPRSLSLMAMAVAGTALNGGHAVEIECLFDGAGAVPAHLLASIGKSFGSLSAESITIASSTVGNWSLLLGIAQNPTDPSGAPANFQLMYP